MTAIQRIVRARIFIIMVPIIPFPISRAQETPLVALGSRTPIVVSVTSQNLNFVTELPSADSMSTTLDFNVPSAFHHDAPITRPRNISQKASAADTYTGTIAREINLAILSFPTLSLSDHLKSIT